jgi:hypothetical protein
MNFAHPEDTFKFILSHVKPDLDLFEAGVAGGGSLLKLINGAEEVGKPFKRVWAADCYQGGLPIEAEGVFKNPDWKPGVFDICKDKGLNSVEEAIAYVSNYVNKDNVVYVPGYFCDSLTEDLAKNIEEEQISYLNVDCDLYISSIQVLEFVFKYNLLCIGSLIRFDDWQGIPENCGQRLAWRQIINKYRVNYFQLTENVFQV